MNSKEFSLTIDNIVKEKEYHIWETVIYHCDDENDFRPKSNIIINFKIIKRKNTIRTH